MKKAKLANCEVDKNDVEAVEVEHRFALPVEWLQVAAVVWSNLLTRADNCRRTPDFVVNSKGRAASITIEFNVWILVNMVLV